MLKEMKTCLVVTFALLVLVCGAYPAVVTGASSLAFPTEAHGSLIAENGRIRGSALVGQTLADSTAHPEYFWGRPSAASVDKDAGVLVSGGSNYGPSNATLVEEVDARVKALRATGVTGDIPADLVTKSASGLDPDASPAAIDLQVPRVAAARHLSEAAVREMIRAHTKGSTFGLLGEPRVSVLALNLDLDSRTKP